MFSLLFYISSESSLMFKILKNCLKSFISFIWNKFSNAFEEMKIFIFFIGMKSDERNVFWNLGLSISCKNCRSEYLDLERVLETFRSEFET